MAMSNLRCRWLDLLCSGIFRREQGQPRTAAGLAARGKGGELAPAAPWPAPVPDGELGVGTLLVCTFVLMDAHRCNHCPGVARCVAQHFRCLAEHPKADSALRALSRRLHQDWLATAEGGAPAPATPFIQTN